MLSKYSIQSFNLETVDNPGWWLEIPLSIIENDRKIEKQYIDESDWFFVSIQDSSVVASGDETKLVQCLLSVMKYFNIQMTPEIGEVLPYLKFLQTWYAEQCDEDWEHSYGVRATIDTNGYCHCSVDLCGTWGYLDEQDFEPVGDSSTFQCRKEGQQLVGEGHVSHIILFLKAFQEWVESILKD